jgi:hypothetical protein
MRRTRATTEIIDLEPNVPQRVKERVTRQRDGEMHRR